MKQPTSDYQEVDRRFDKAFEEKYRHASNPDATEHCVKCDTRHSHHYHSLDQDKQREWIKSYFHSELDRVREETIKECGDFIKERITYIKKYTLKGDYTNGFSGNESGDCCDKCRIDKKKIMESGMAVALRLTVGCKDPFQINCKCHIPFRKVATKAELSLLEELLWYFEVRPDLLAKDNK